MSSATVDDARQWQALRAPGLQVAFLGSGALTGPEASLCEHLGPALSRWPHVAVTTSGYAGHKEHGSFTMAVARSFARHLEKRDVERRVTTFLVAARDGTVPSGIGRRVLVRGRSRMNRQAQIVAKSDVLCVAGGGAGTKDLARLALQIDKPMLPLPFFPGASRELWDEHQEDVRREFSVDDDQSSRWSALDVGGLSEEQIDELAREIVATLLRTARGTCFVCMPFAAGYLPVYLRIVEPAIAASHLHAVRMDRTPCVGDIAARLRAEIEAATCVVAVLDGLSPNVLYEVGFAHALRKPVILVQGVDADRSSDPAVPFDVRTHRVVSYPCDLDREGIARAIDELHALLRSSAHGV